MKCIIYDCDNQAEYPYPACDTDHGYKWKCLKDDLVHYQNGDKTTDGKSYPDYFNTLSINELEYYAGKLPR